MLLDAVDAAFTPRLVSNVNTPSYLFLFKALKKLAKSTTPSPNGTFSPDKFLSLIFSQFSLNWDFCIHYTFFRITKCVNNSFYIF